MRKLLFLIVLIAHTSLLFAQESTMSDPEITSFKAMVNKTSKTMITIQSNFTQYKHMDFFVQ